MLKKAEIELVVSDTAHFLVHGKGETSLLIPGSEGQMIKATADLCKCMVLPAFHGSNVFLKELESFGSSKAVYLTQDGNLWTYEEGRGIEELTVPSLGVVNQVCSHGPSILLTIYNLEVSICTYGCPTHELTTVATVMASYLVTIAFVVVVRGRG